MSRFVRQSSYRHVFGQPAKKELVHDNVKISASAWDTNLVTASGKYLAVNYQASGGGAFLVTPLDETGKLPDLFPLCRAHTAPVLDTAWSPFDDSLVASAGEDGRVAITRVDEQILRNAWSGEPDVPDLEPVAKFNAHGRKAGHVLWHPTADGILASASNDVKIWDVSAQKAVYTSDTHADMVQSLSWDFCGTVYATTCKDKKLRLFDPRAGSSAVTVADSHSGIKGSRVEWMGSLDRIVTTGFSKMSERQVYVWDSRDLVKGPVKTITIDQSSGTLMPFWNASNNILFLAGKGDGNVRYYEYENDDLHYLTEFSSPQPQRGMCFLPSRAVNVAENEIARAFKAVGSMIEPISFIVPRKSDAFQADLYPPAPSATASLSAEEWLSGKTAEPILVNMENQQQSAPVAVAAKSYTPPTPAPAPVPAPAPAATPTPPRTASPAPVATPTRAPSEPKPEPKPEPVAATIVEKSTPSSTPASNGSSSGEEVASLRKENEKLKGEVAERDTIIRELELKLERVRAFAKDL
ncbi:hypothetical protein BCR35DRAFT_310850 [Leucosporidium creatinivorum]|uniref:DUF1899 domain-containing protein n=1 Tax=Leucosporidium creatinivorum TaxID=106004 RepID=A0A1Y2CN01_9BASI|nr:hypothetical protein BCR35DRAFT_310850 [Leucosporidium creatinivorum]